MSDISSGANGRGSTIVNMEIKEISIESSLLM
jgi:hypothetical protein